MSEETPHPESMPLNRFFMKVLSESVPMGFEEIPSTKLDPLD